MNLKVRFAISMGCVVAAVGIGAGGLAYWSARNELVASTDQFLRTRAEEIRQPISETFRDGTRFDRDRPPPDGTISRPAAAGRLFSNLDTTNQIINSNGDVTLGFADARLPVTSRDTEIALAGTGEQLQTVTVDGVASRMITVGLDDLGALQIARSVAEDQAVLSALRNRLLAAVSAGIGIALAAGWLIARRVTSPVERLTESAQRIADTQDLTTPVSVEGDGEVASLARSFNIMLAALGASKDQQQRLVQDASHELRTPLTSVRTGIELLQRPDLPEPDRVTLLANLRSEAEQLTDLVTELVTAATDSPSVAEEMVPTDLAALALRTAQRASSRSGRSIEVTHVGRAQVLVRPTDLERALANLIDNALKYSPPSSPIDVAVNSSADLVTLAVTDLGPGIAAADTERIFDRFYRADDARAMPGSGLGLAIVRKVVEEHGGTVGVDTTWSEGTRIVIGLPATNEPSTSN